MSAQNESSATAVQLSFNFDRDDWEREVVGSAKAPSPIASVAYLATRREHVARKQELDAYTRVIEYARSLRQL